MKIFQDSKELPLFNYERITETKDFYYMIKGYDGSDPPENINIKDLENKFNDIIKHYAASLNEKNAQLKNHGLAQKSYLELAKMETIYNIIVLKIKENQIRTQNGLDIDNSVISELLQNIKIQKPDDLEVQLEIIKKRISKHQDDLNVYLSKIKQSEDPNAENEDISTIIANVEILLERTIDAEKTTLYRFGVMQKHAIKKIEQLNEINERYAR